MTNAERFIEKYKELEAAVREVYGLSKSDSIAYCLGKQSKFQECKNDFEFCRDVRNFIQHERKINNKFAIEPSEEMVRFLTELIARVRDRKSCLESAVPMEKVLYGEPSHRVGNAVRAMRKGGYTHLPILRDGRVIGVFSESSVLDYLGSGECISAVDDLKFSDMSEHLSLSGGSQRYLFFGAHRYVDELEEEVDVAYKRGKRVGMVFITENGKSTEKLLGIMTPWDIISANG